MWTQFKKFLKSRVKSKNSPCTYEQVNYNPKFQLKYQDNIIGYLNHDDSVWTFGYSEWFKNQNELEPLLEFPIKNKSYASIELWPFFESRIPSKKQPKVQEYLQAHPADKNNKVKLLELFGMTSANNPYKLILNL